MTYEEKFDLIIKAIVEARKPTRKGQDTKLYLTSDNGLKPLNPNEIYDILLKLQDDEGILFVQDIPSAIKKLFETDFERKDYFILEIKETFGSWYEKRLIANKSRLENLSEINLNNIIHIMHLIEQQLELDQSEKVMISFVSSVHELEGYERADIDELINTYARSLTYLKNIGVINDFITSDMSLSSELILNITRFFEVLEQINNLAQARKIIKKDEDTKRATSKQPEEKTNVVYEITYTPSREVLLNKTYLLAKPDFNTENDLVFSHLYKHPNQKFTKQQLEEAIDKKLTKDLHKIVENLGFKADIRKMFFSVSGTSISFKNPITQEDLEALGIQKIKIS